MNQNMLAQAVARVMPAVRACGLLTGLATFQSSDANDFPDGFYSGQYQDLASLVNLPCIDAPETTSYISATEVKAIQNITSSELRHVLLGDFYPALEDGWRDGWRVVIGRNDGSGNMIDGVPYDLMGAGVDSQSQHSVCKVRLTSV